MCFSCFVCAHTAIGPLLLSGVFDDGVLFGRPKTGALKNTLIAYGYPLLCHTLCSVGGPEGTYV